MSKRRRKSKRSFRGLKRDCNVARVDFEPGDYVEVRYVCPRPGSAYKTEYRGKRMRGIKGVTVKTDGHSVGASRNGISFPVGTRNKCSTKAVGNYLHCTVED